MKIDWEKIHARESFIDLAGCWQRCDSYCCKTNHPDFNFRFIRPGQVQLPLCPEEYRYLASIDCLPDPDPAALSRHGVEFAPGQRAQVYMVRCDRGGDCRHPAQRPLICKIYPYLPVPDPSGRILALAPASVFDAARQTLDDYKACPALRQETPAMRQQALDNFPVLFTHPHLIFYFRLAHELMNLMQSQLHTHHADILKLEPRQFFRKWEVLYMTGALLPGERVRKLAATHYQAVAAHWGDFRVD